MPGINQEMSETQARDDLEQLSEIYWEVERRGKQEHAESLSRIYYTYEAMLDANSVTENARALPLTADLTEEDTVDAKS